MKQGLLLVAAAMMRLSCLGLIEFKADEALTVLSLQEWIKQPYLIQAGLISSTGARNFPLFQYLLLPAAIISTDPRWLSGFIGLINTGMIGWFYIATNRKFGPKAALMAGLLLAVSPYPVLYARKIWAQDLVMWLAVPIYDLLLRKKPAYVWLGLMLALQAQLHGSGIFFGSLVVAYLGWTKKINWRLIGGLLVGLLPTLPYFVSGSLTRPQTPYQAELSHMLMPAKLLTTWSWNEIMGEQDYAQFANQSPAVGLGVLVGIILIIALVVGGYYTRRAAGLIAGLIGIYMLAGVPARLHYYQVVLPYIAVVSARGLVHLFKKQPLFLGPTLGLIVTANLLFWGMFLRYVAVNQGVSGDYGVPYQDSHPRVETAVQTYELRSDINQIRAVAAFDPVAAKQTKGAMIHYNLGQYFDSMHESDLSVREFNLAIDLDERFRQIEMGSEPNVDGQ